MSVPIDVEKSAKARGEGNASFKKGKWVESIGHYTNASVFNPTDPAPLCNRAQCYLNLEKWHDAERDCNTVLGLQADHVKALFRRGVARKELGKVAEAISDFERVTQLDPKNSAVKSELNECRRTADAKPRVSRNIPLAKAVPSTPAAPATITEIHDDPETTAPKPRAAPASFTAARRTRDTKRSFVASSAPQPVQPPAEPLGKTAPEPSIARAPVVSNEASAAASMLPQDPPPSRTPLSPPRNPSSLSAGSGIALVRKIEECRTDADRWSMLSHYEPENLPKLLSSLLEPEVLASLLMALQHAAQQEPNTHTRVQSFLCQIPRIPGFKTSSSMLLPSERKAGQEAWTTAGGVGTWPSSS